MINKLIKLASQLDEMGCIKSADYIDCLVRKIAEDEVAEQFYHLSSTKFDNFQQQYKNDQRLASEIGFHFGTKETALTVADKLKHEGIVKPGDTVYLYAVNLKTSNPLKLSENRLGSWTVNSIIREIFEGLAGEPHSFVTDEMLDDYDEDIITTPSGENLKDLSFEPERENSEFISWINNLGFDSIKYENTYEGGGESMLVFASSQIEIDSVEEYTVS